ncbi:MAG: TlyA family RNA methyltransferase [Chloroflexi bacterium]|nr:TlyA family RNA methyltransferase [Chloroflexota bacterium]MBT5319436.1 TlyA family RNA methyltransferase [Chloroflexota bacterium]
MRLDQLMVETGLTETVEEARALVLAGEVSLPGTHGRPTAGQQVREGQEVVLRDQPRFVSRGGEKLSHALESFGVDPTGFTVLDVGASTGGFTDCVLQAGANRVYAVDAGHSQIHSRLVADERVISMENVNARDPIQLPEPVDLIVADVSFISLEVILPPVFEHLRVGGRAIVLFKPQFEALNSEVPRGGVIRDPSLRAQLVGRFVAWLTDNRIRIRGLIRSPILGDAGNAEFLFWLEPPVALSEL